MHAVGKVHRRGALGQLHNGGLGREHINAVVKHRGGFAAAGLGQVTPGRAAGEFSLPGQELAQHRNLGVIGTAGRHPGVAFGASFFVGPVGRHAVLGMLVHGLGADLHFDGLALGVAHHGVQGLVAVAFGLGDVIVKLFGHGHKLAVHPAQSGIASVHRGHDDTQGAYVKHLVKAQRLAAHFFDDAVDVFGATLHLRIQPLGAQITLQSLAHCFDRRLALGPLLVQPLGHLAVGLGLQKAKRQVLNLPLHFPNTQAVGQRRKHLQGLGGQARRQGPFARGEVTQGLQSRSQTQHDHPQVARKSQQHFAHALGLRGRGLRHGRRLRTAAGGVLGNARHALQAYQLGGL